MATTIYNSIQIEPAEAMDKICDMFDETNGDTTSIVKKFYTEEDLKRPYGNDKTKTEYPITEDGVLISWLYDNVGVKWITGGVDDNIKLETANYLPDGFLIKLYQICTEEFDDVKITCNWYDEYETNIGTAIVKDGVYTEDEEALADESIDDPSYSVTGEEDFDEIKEWVLNQITENSYTSREEMEEKDENVIRNIFEDWKNETKWEHITSAWENMGYSCEEAIDTDDMDFPISKVRRIAKKKFEIIENCYPFK
jgi:hypothetical protein